MLALLYLSSCKRQNIAFVRIYLNFLQLSATRYAIPFKTNFVSGKSYNYGSLIRILQFMLYHDETTERVCVSGSNFRKHNRGHSVQLGRLRHETLKHAGNGPLWPRYKVRKYEWNVVLVTGNWQKWQDSGLYINIKQEFNNHTDKLANYLWANNGLHLSKYLKLQTQITTKCITFLTPINHNEKKLMSQIGHFVDVVNKKTCHCSAIV